jgi:hypothetical protein
MSRNAARRVFSALARHAAAEGALFSNATGLSAQRAGAMLGSATATVRWVIAVDWCGGWAGSNVTLGFKTTSTIGSEVLHHSFVLRSLSRFRSRTAPT